MASTGQKWLIGCGIGCGVVILIVLLLIGAGAFLVRDTVKNFKAVETITEQLEAEYGTVESFCPPADGGITGDRIGRFVAVRDSMLDISGDIATRVDDMMKNIDRMENDEVNSFGDVLQIIQKGAGVLPQLADFYYTRSSALLANEMGLGEYLYLYVTIYFGFLEHNPGDGPPFKLMDHHRRSGVTWNDDKDEDLSQEEVIERRRIWVSSIVRDLMLDMLTCQLENLEESDTTDHSLKQALMHEIEALKEDKDRLVWEDGMPRALTRNLEPYRIELELRYDTLLNPLEIMGELDD